MKKYLIYLVAAGLIFVAYKSFAEGLSTLAEVGRSQGYMQKELKDETRNFKKVKKAVEKGYIKKGDSQKDIARKYGEPVIKIKDRDYPEEWIYKPSYVDWFKGVKIYLFFDENKTLAGIKMVNK